ncbi:MAG: hypothetical protein ABI810_12345 [Sphingomonas bacterium]
MAQELIAELDRLESAGFPVSRSRSTAFFAPRTSLNYAVFNAEIEQFTEDLGHSRDIEADTAAFIEAQFSTAIRRWRHLDPDLEVIEYATDIASSVLVCRDACRGGISVHLEGPFLANCLHVLGCVLGPDAFTATPPIVEAGRAWFRKPVSDSVEVVPALQGLGVNVAGRLRPFCGPGLGIVTDTSS